MIEKRFPADTALKKPNLEEFKTFLNDKKLDGELYAYLQSYSKHDGDIETYALKKDLPIQSEICSKIGIASPMTLRRHLKYLIDRGFVIDKEDRYVLPLQEDIYFMIPLRTLQFLLNNCREHVIKIYIYLGQRWKWSQSRKEPYTFSYKEIATHIGINSKGNEARVNLQIKNALELLVMAEMIEYEEVYVDKVPYKKLTKFSFDYKNIEIKRVTKTKK